MTPEFVKGLSALALKLTLPVLLFTSSLNCQQNRSNEPCGDLANNIAEGWPLLLLPFWYVGLGLAVGALAAFAGGARTDNRRAAIACVAFANSTSLPITLLQTIRAQFSPSSAIGSTNPLLFLGVYLALYPMLQWTVGLALLRPTNAAEPPPPKPLQHSSDGAVSESAEADRAVAAGGRSLPEVQLTESGARDVAVPHRQLTMPLTVGSTIGGTDRHSGWIGLTARLCARAWKHRASLFPPPALGALSGVVVALIRPLSESFVDVGDRDDDAPLEWAFNALLQLGSAAVPVNMLLLGSTLMKAVQQREALRQAISLRLAFCIAFARLLVMPATGLLTAMAIHASGLVAAGVSQTFYLVVMMVTCTPTANSIVLMTELAGCNKEAVSASILLQYVLSPITLTLWLFVYMSVVLQL